MRARVTFYAKSQTVNAAGEVVDSFGTGNATWAAVYPVDQRRGVRFDRYDYPVTHVCVCRPNSLAVAGSRVKVGAKTFEVLGTDDTGYVSPGTRPEFVTLDLRETP